MLEDIDCKSSNIQNLSSSLALALGNLLQDVVAGKRRVGGTEAGVGSAVDALLLAVVDELGRGVVGVELDLVDGWYCLHRCQPMSAL